MHESVLLQEAVSALAIEPDGFYIDGTFGRGGHSREILASLSKAGRLWGFDKDEEAVEKARDNFHEDSRFTCFHASFATIRDQVAAAGLLGQVKGLLLDLGVSSPQLDNSERGFSFRQDGPLDMRMNNACGMSAADWINHADAYEIRKVLQQFGEENFAGLIAKRIVKRREEKPFERTLDLANLIMDVVPARFHQKKHPATRSFQAIRMHINNELGDLQQLLDDVVSLLAVGGRLVVISFHSLEDRMVKRFIRAQEKGPEIPRNIPVIHLDREPHLKSCSKAMKPSSCESTSNVRARSAVMRIAEKVAGDA